MLCRQFSSLKSTHHSQQQKNVLTKNSYFKIRLCTDLGLVWGLSITSETLHKIIYILTTIKVFELQTTASLISGRFRQFYFPIKPRSRNWKTP